MSDALLFILFFGGLFVARAVVATIVFYWILPGGDRCPGCDSVTLRLQPNLWGRLLPRLRKSWCYECGWEGMLRFDPAPRLGSEAGDKSRDIIR